MTTPTKTAPTLEILREHRDEILRLAEHYGASNVRVFGSVARGDATPESDVDLLMTFRKGSSLYDLSGLWQDLTELLGTDITLLSDHDGIRERLRKNLHREAVSL